MAIIRNIDDDNDWTFGKGKNDYRRNSGAVALDIRTRLQELLGDSFFNNGAGIDWLNLLGSKNLLPLHLAVSSVILNTQNVAGLKQINIENNAERNVTISYEVLTIFGSVVDQVNFSIDI